ncbi:MAG: hypothetical protein FJX42_06935 [Alphaproteobacteria bacterium]|nr:hypothetical protein [Alphaproteobacteria bacterium]
MIRIFFEYVLPLIAPFLFYFGWVWMAARRAEETGGAAPDWRKGPWIGLGAAGLVLLMIALVATAWLGGEPAGGVYRAPALDKDGRIVPGYFERQKP